MEGRRGERGRISVVCGRQKKTKTMSDQRVEWMVGASQRVRDSREKKL